ncbi:MAG: M48 family metallopeptidase [Leptospiraceae bacterium]
MKGKKKFAILPLLLFLALAAWKYFSADTWTNPETGEEIKIGLSEDQEESLGMQSYRQVLAESEVLTSGPEVEMVRRVVQRLIPTTGDGGDDFEWEVNVVRNNQVNAFCLPGGKIVVYTGILPVAQDEAGLATVIGHEMAHATMRHGAQRLFSNDIYNTVMQGANASMAEMDPAARQKVLGLLGAGAKFGVMLPFSRDHETEADKIGLLYMARAGYDPEASVAFWQRMAEQGGGGGPEFASTHPSHGTRIDNLRKFIPEARKQMP